MNNILEETAFFLIRGVKKKTRKKIQNYYGNLRKRNARRNITQWQRSHLLGKKHYGRIIDLSSVNLLATLKGKTVSITENLTKMIVTEMKITWETYGFKNLWPENFMYWRKW